jgi:hypothetical protein
MQDIINSYSCMLFNWGSKIFTHINVLLTILMFHILYFLQNTFITAATTDIEIIKLNSLL